jgi:hypothetical protein
MSAALRTVTTRFAVPRRLHGRGYLSPRRASASNWRCTRFSDNRRHGIGNANRKRCIASRLKCCPVMSGGRSHHSGPTIMPGNLTTPYCAASTLRANAKGACEGVPPAGPSGDTRNGNLSGVFPAAAAIAR